MPVKPRNIDAYIASFPTEIRKRLELVRATIVKAAPGATESMKWSMPSFSYKRILVNFAAFKNHIGFYPTPSAILAFAKEIKGYTNAKGSVQFPHDKPLPLGLIKKMTQLRVKEAKQEDAKWRS